MTRRLPLIFIGLCAMTAFGAQVPKEVKSALQGIQTAAGKSIWERVHTCRMTFSDGSWTEKADRDIPAIGAKQGDIIIEAFINIPPMPGTDMTSAYRDILARWVVHNGKPSPESGWARNLQLEPYPMPSFPWLHC